MNKHEAVIFLFTIAKEIKRSFEKPVILMTLKDYAEGIYTTLVDMRSALLQQAEPQRVLDIVTAFHNEWLAAINDVESFRKRLRGTPRETVLRAIDFTKESIKKRQKAFTKYIMRLQSTLTEEEISLMLLDLDIIADLQKSVFAVLTEKQKTLRNTADPEEYYNKLSDEIEELMNWLDTLNDRLAIHFSKVLCLKLPRLTSDLTKTLQQIIDEINAKGCPDNNVDVTTETQRQGRRISCMVRLQGAEDLEIRDIIKKIQILQGRIDRLKDENSSAVMALEHKTHYLEERLQSLEDLKTSLSTLKSKQEFGMEISQEDLPNTFHIFDHLLPSAERGRLVEELMELWTEAITGYEDSKSIISILSVTDMKEVFSDDMGKFVVDKYGRKVYKVGASDYIYQTNERNQLVPIHDDNKHVYFFDDCGRYYIDEHENRIYKAYDNASEYMFNREGFLLKVSEIRGATKYFYDAYGKYYYDENQKQIYYDDKTQRQYERDDFGNLNLIRSKEVIYKHAPVGPIQLEENIYLKEAVGDALTACIASVVMRQPADPILYLSERLVTYRRNQQLQQLRELEQRALAAEREMRMRANTPEPEESDCGTEATTVILDKNFVNYKTMEIPTEQTETMENPVEKKS